jgi:hypothetical protein
MHRQAQAAAERAVGLQKLIVHALDAAPAAVGGLAFSRRACCFAARQAA